MTNNFYVYEHWRPDRDECFYVGKGKGKRANSMYKRNPHHKAIQGKLSRSGMCVEVRIVASGLTEAEAFALEIERIKFWKEANIDLANVAEGGGGNTGFKHSKETMAIIATKNRGKKRPPEFGEMLSKKLKGRIFSEEHLRKMSEVKKGKPVSPLARQKLADWSKNGVRTEQHKKNISEAQKRRFQDPIVKEQFRLHSVGRVPSEETRMKMSIAAKNRRNREKLVAEGKLSIAPASP